MEPEVRKLRLNDPGAAGSVYDFAMGIKAEGIVNPLGEIHLISVPVELSEDPDAPYSKEYCDEFRSIAERLYGRVAE